MNSDTLAHLVFRAAYWLRGQEQCTSEEYQELLRLSEFLGATKHHGQLTLEALIAIEREKIECDRRHKS